MNRMLIIGGAPKVPVDAVRYLSVHASGGTARRLAAAVRAVRGVEAIDLMLPSEPQEEAGILHYGDRQELDALVAGWVERQPEGIVVCSAAINDYQVAGVESVRDGECQRWPAGSKVPSGADEIRILLRPAPKLVDALRGSWGHAGPLVVFKYEHADTVIESAQRLRTRVGASLAVANSLCGSVQCLVDDAGVHHFPDRAQLERELADTLSGWF